MKFDFKHIDPATGLPKVVKRGPEIQLMNRMPGRTGWIWLLQNRVDINTVGNCRYKKKVWYDRADMTVSTDESKEDAVPFRTYNLPGAGRPGGWLYGNELHEYMHAQEPKENKVFLGGTCNGSEWREELMPMLDIAYFNPVVDDWTPQCQLEEERQKSICKWQLYVITPQIKGVFSIAEVVQSSNKDPEHTIFCILNEYQGESFQKFMIKSLDATAQLVRSNGANVCYTLKDCADILNNKVSVSERKINRFTTALAESLQNILDIK